MRKPVAVCGFLLVAACTGGPAGPPRAQDTPPSTQAATAGPVVAVVRRSGGLELFRVAAGRYELQRFATVPGPAGAKAVDVSVSAGARPTVCAVWERGDESTLTCHAGGSGPGRFVTTAPADRMSAIAVSHGGGSVAWLVRNVPGDPDLYHVRPAGGRAGAATHIPAFGASGRPDGDEAALQVNGLAWSGEDTLVVSHAYDADVNGSLAVVPVGGAPRGWAGGPNVPSAADSILGRAISSSAGIDLLAVQQGPGAAGDAPPRAVRLDIRSGKVLAVVAGALPGRSLESVSGGPGGVLYRTDGDSGPRTFWRWPGDDKGRPLEGLPADSATVVAQP